MTRINVLKKSKEKSARIREEKKVCHKKKKSFLGESNTEVKRKKIFPVSVEKFSENS